MHVLIQQLLRLQALEKALLDTEKQMEGCDRSLESFQRLEQKLREELIILEQSLKSFEEKYQKDEAHLIELESCLIQQKTKVLSLKKAEEYAVLERTIEELKQKISALQDDLILRLETLEAMRLDYTKKVAEVEAQVSECQNKAQQLLERKHLLKMKKMQQADDMRTFETTLQGDFYQAYLTLRQCHKTMPFVVEITNDEKCSGCFLALSKTLVDKVESLDEPQFCEHCGRILYRLKEDE